MVKRLKPEPDDYFVLKPKHSGFFSTTLELLLQHLDADTLIIFGLAGNTCVHFTANGAYQRDFSLVVPSDLVELNTKAENLYALEQIAKLLKVDTRPAMVIKLESLVSRQANPEHHTQG